MWKLLCTHKEGALKLKINSISIWARAKCCIAFVSIRDVYMPTRRRSRVTEKYIKTELNSVLNCNIRYVYISLVSIKFTFWKIEHFHRQNDIFTVKKLPQVISFARAYGIGRGICSIAVLLQSLGISLRIPYVIGVRLYRCSFSFHQVVILPITNALSVVSSFTNYNSEYEHSLCPFNECL